MLPTVFKTISSHLSECWLVFRDITSRQAVGKSSRAAGNDCKGASPLHESCPRHWSCLSCRISGLLQSRCDGLFPGTPPLSCTHLLHTAFRSVVVHGAYQGQLQTLVTCVTMVEIPTAVLNVSRTEVGRKFSETG